MGTENLRNDMSITDNVTNLINHVPIIDLMCRQKPPTPENVIEVRNALWHCGVNVDAHFFLNLMELAVRHEDWCRQEFHAYTCVSEYLGGVVLGGPSQPDVSLPDGTPVEIKVGAFNAAALRQLTRYMSKAGVERGVACATSLSVELPTTVSFVQIRFDGDENKYEVVSPRATPPQTFPPHPKLSNVIRPNHTLPTRP